MRYAPPAFLVGGARPTYYLHCCVAAGANTGVAIDIEFTEGVLSDDFSASFNLLDPTIYRAAFLADSGGTAAGARDRFFAGYLANSRTRHLGDADYRLWPDRCRRTAASGDYRACLNAGAHSCGCQSPPALAIDAR